MPNTQFVRITKSDTLIIHRKRFPLKEGELYPVKDDKVYVDNEWVADLDSDYARQHFAKVTIQKSKDELKNEINALHEELEVDIHHGEHLYDKDMLDDFCVNLRKLEKYTRQYQALNAQENDGDDR